MIHQVKEIKAYLLFGLTILIGIIHVWTPVTLSPIDPGERAVFTTVIVVFVLIARAGYSSGRIGIGLSFLFAATVNLLIAVSFGSTTNLLNLLELVFWTFLLGLTGIALMSWKEIRIFENRRSAEPVSLQS